MKINTFWIVSGLFGLLAIAKHSTLYLPALASILSSFIFAYQIYTPLLYIQGRHESILQYNLYAYNLLAALQTHIVNLFSSQRAFTPMINVSRLKADLRRVGYMSVLTLLPFACFFYFYQQQQASHYGFHLQISLSALWGLLGTLLTESLLVALPEEVFYRGFLQTRLLRRFKTTYTFAGVTFGAATVLTSLVFACAHFIGEYHPTRLLTFFPGLLFSSLTLRSRSILGATLYHGICNTFAWLLTNMFIWAD